MASSRPLEYEEMVFDDSYEHFASDFEDDEVEKEERQKDNIENEEPRREYFDETLEQLETLAKFLACVKCNELPMSRVFTLGNCIHKYCEKCVTSLLGKACLVCEEASYPKDARQDLFSTSLLEKIPTLYELIKRLMDQNLICHTEEEKSEVADNTSSPAAVIKPLVKSSDDAKQGEDVDNMKLPDESYRESLLDSSEKDVSSQKMDNCVMLFDEDEDKMEVDVGDADVKDAGNETNDKLKNGENEIILLEEIDGAEKCTPATKIMPFTPDPDVMEETPQNKASSSITILKGRRSSKGNKVRPILLQLSPSTTKTNPKNKKWTKVPKESKEKLVKPSEPEVEMRKDVVSTEHDEILFSDEELFRSQVSEAAGKEQLPVLTPNFPGKNKLKNNKNPSSPEKPGDIPESIEITSRKQKPKKRFFKSKEHTRSSEEEELPDLTPYATNNTSVNQKIVDRSVITVKQEAIGKRKSTIVSNRIKEKYKDKNVEATKPTGTPKSSKGSLRKSTKATVIGTLLTAATTPSTTADGSFVYEFKSESVGVEKKKMERNMEKRQQVKAESSSVLRTPSVRTCAPSPTLSKDKLEKRNPKGETGLHVACRMGQFDRVKFLVDEGADINAKDNAGWTPLHEVISGKAPWVEKERIVKYLCSNGCDLNEVGGLDDETPLHAAAAFSTENCVELLLELGASPNVRKTSGKLPIDLTFNENIIRLLKEKMSGESTPSVVAGSSIDSSDSNYNSALTTVSEQDPAVLQVMLKKALLFFNYEVDENIVVATKTTLNLKVSEKLTPNVTHIIHKTEKYNDPSLFQVPFSYEYIYGIAHGQMHVSDKWIKKSIDESKGISPAPFEVSGLNYYDPGNLVNRYPTKSRVNRERGHPGLLDGFSFYLYKSCVYKSTEDQGRNVSKRELTTLIQGAGGKVINREPNPETVDPLECPTRFHADSQSIFTLTSHITLYDEENAPPQNKLYNMEHVKTLKTAWLIESLLKFQFEKPDEFL